MTENQNSGYGQSKNTALPLTLGKTFFVVADNSVNFQPIDGLFKFDADGLRRRYATYTAALAACVAGRGDSIVVASDYATAITAAELLAAETKGVTIYQASSKSGSGKNVAYRATAALPQSVAAPIFTVTGRVRITSIIGQVTTVIQNQANNAKLIANPTVGTDVDLCAVADIAADAVGTQLSITGTLANALVETPSGAFVDQASPVVVLPGTLDLSCSASSTGAVKWFVEYEAIDPGAKIIAA